jgi:hypothetical protein
MTWSGIFLYVCAEHSVPKLSGGISYTECGCRRYVASYDFSRHYLVHSLVRMYIYVLVNVHSLSSMGVYVINVLLDRYICMQACMMDFACIRCPMHSLYVRSSRVAHARVYVLQYILNIAMRTQKLTVQPAC